MRYKGSKKKKLNIPLNYPLPNLYYFSGNILKEIRRQSSMLVSILNKEGFKECHFPFLVPRSICLTTIRC